MRKTRRQLRDALLALVLERGWADVSVQDVCVRADIGRSTFYVHFADKEDLLLSGFDDLHAELAAIDREANGPFAFAELLFHHAATNADLLRAVAGRESAQQIQWRFRDVVRSLVEADLTGRKIAPSRRAALVQFVAGGFVELLVAWLDDPRGVTPGELAAMFHELAGAAVAAVSGP